MQAGVNYTTLYTIGREIFVGKKNSNCDGS